VAGFILCAAPFWRRAFTTAAIKLFSVSTTFLALERKEEALRAAQQILLKRGGSGRGTAITDPPQEAAGPLVGEFALEDLESRPEWEYRSPRPGGVVQEYRVLRGELLYSSIAGEVLPEDVPVLEHLLDRVFTEGGFDGTRYIELVDLRALTGIPSVLSRLRFARLIRTQEQRHHCRPRLNCICAVNPGLRRMVRLISAVLAQRYHFFDDVPAALRYLEEVESGAFSTKRIPQVPAQPEGFLVTQNEIDEIAFLTGHLLWSEEEQELPAELVSPGNPLRQLEETLLALQCDLLELRKREREQAQALRQAQKMEAVGQLAGGIAHDFNNMLAAILGHTEMALEDCPPGQTLHSQLLKIQRCAERSAGLTRQLLAFARKQEVLPSRMDLNSAIEKLLDLLQRLIGDSVKLAWQPAPDLSAVTLDGTQLDQMIINLCVNARDAIAEGGTITLSTGSLSIGAREAEGHAGLRPGEYVCVVVADTGCGMDAGTLAHIFEPFFTTKPQGKGTGLGLSTVYGIVKQNHGYVQVESELGRGSTFRVMLPPSIVEPESP
jgi:signal transduction histidine kinase